MIRKEYLLSRIESLEATRRDDWEHIIKLERLVDQLCEELGYRVTYKQGLYLEPIEDYADE